MKTYIVTNGGGTDVIGGMAQDGYGVPFDDLPGIAQAAIRDGSYQYTKHTQVTSHFDQIEMDYYVREE